MSFIRISSIGFLGLYVIALCIITYIASSIGTASSIMVTENFNPAISASILMRNPYTVFPLDPDIILGDGYAKYRRGISVPAIRMLIVEENRENVLTAMINRRKNITREYDSIRPGEPPTHLTEFIQRSIQPMRSISPGNTNERGIESICVFHVYVLRLKKSSAKKLIFAKSIMPIL